MHISSLQEARKGYAGFFFGAGTILLILLTAYVFVSLSFPALGDQIVNELQELTSAARAR